MSKTFMSRLMEAIGDNEPPEYLKQFIESEVAKNAKPRSPNLGGGVKKETFQAIRDLYQQEGKLCVSCPFLPSKQ